MKLPRDLSGADPVRPLCRHWGYQVVHQVGSHVVLETKEPAHQRLTVPNHRALRIGTLYGILHAVADHKAVAREDILSFLR
jgi:predicted RNA binding protein YcfA (HicA-like mRNA interferase family)